MNHTSNEARVAVCGGGIAGLACAWRLVAQGVPVTLYEASDRLGGLGTWFEHDGQRLEKFYHVLLDSDRSLLSLIRELGLGSSLVWRETGMGFVHRGQSYAFNTPLDLLRFRALSLPDRVRTGLGALYITKGVRDGASLDDELAVDWLPRVFGRRVFERIWDPLLAAKFGDRRAGVPAYWVWNLLQREKDGSQEIKGTVLGGFHALTVALERAIRARGGDIRLGAAVDAVEADAQGATVTVAGAREGRRAERFAAAICTLPLPLVHRLVRGPVAADVPVPDLEYQGVVNVVLLLRERLMSHYWTAVVDSDFPFQGIVETTHVIPPESVGGRHILYLMNYCGPEHSLYRSDDAALEKMAREGLARLAPRYRDRDVEAVYVFRAPHVEPVWTRGYLRRRPAPQVGATRLFLCTTAQAYPMVTAWNTSVKLATDVVNEVTAVLS